MISRRGRDRKRRALHRARRADYLPKPSTRRSRAVSALSADAEKSALQDASGCACGSSSSSSEIGRELHECHFSPTPCRSPRLEIASAFHPARQWSAAFLRRLPARRRPGRRRRRETVCDKGIGAALFWASFGALLPPTPSCTGRARPPGRRRASTSSSPLTNGDPHARSTPLNMFATILLRDPRPGDGRAHLGQRLCHMPTVVRLDLGSLERLPQQRPGRWA